MRFSFFLPISAIAWSDSGHYFAADIANIVMKQSTRFWVHSQIGGGAKFDAALRAASIWADHEGQSEETDEYHFVHTPYRVCSPYVSERDCGFGGSGKCLVSGIDRYFKDAVTAAGPVAVKMLIHLIADLFQPLHTGFAEDHGGNSIDLVNTDAVGEGISLHAYWDRLVTTESLASDGTVLSRKSILARASSVNIGQLNIALNSPNGVSAWFAGLVSENSKTNTCGFAYVQTDGSWIRSGDLLDSQYEMPARQRAINLLISAGVVLGKTLDHIAGVWNARKVVPDISRPVVPETPSNRFAILSVDEFDFDPEEIAEIDWTLKPSEVKAKRSTLFLGLDLAEVGIRLVNRPSGWYITSEDRADIVATPGRPDKGFVTYAVQFAGSRTVKFNIDVAAFREERAVNSEFILQLIYRLKGRKYSGKTIVPRGKDSPVLERMGGVFSSVYPEGESFSGDTTSMVSHFGARLQIPSSSSETLHIAIESGTVLSARDLMKRRIRQGLAASAFPSLSSPEEQIQAYTETNEIPKRCSEVLISEQRPGVVFLTSRAALARSAGMSGNPIRAWGINAELASSGNILLLVDQILVEDLMSPQTVQMLLKCGLTHKNVNGRFLSVDRPTIVRELDELYSEITKSPRQLQDPPVVANDIFLYISPECPVIGVLLIEWKLRNIDRPIR
jgi:hypothetical protein